MAALQNFWPNGEITADNLIAMHAYTGRCRHDVRNLPINLQYQLMNEVLSKKELDENFRLDLAKILLNNRIKCFTFVQQIEHLDTGLKIMNAIMLYSPKIENIDFRAFYIKTNEYKACFIKLLKKYKNLNTLQLKTDLRSDCAIRNFICKDFDTLNDDVKQGLEKITMLEIHNSDVELGIIPILFQRLPILHSLGMYYKLSARIHEYIQENYFHAQCLSLTEFFDFNTKLSTLERIAKLCPEVKRIVLIKPNEGVVANLGLFRMLTHIELAIFSRPELMDYLMLYGQEIISLKTWNKKCDLEEDKLRAMLPNLFFLDLKRDFSDIMYLPSFEY